jgi:hypothetical protein
MLACNYILEIILMFCYSLLCMKYYLCTRLRTSECLFPYMILWILFYFIYFMCVSVDSVYVFLLTSSVSNILLFYGFMEYLNKN